MNYTATSNIREVIKFYNLGDKTFETDFSMVLKHHPSRGARFEIRFLVNSSVYLVCKSLKNKLRVAADQTVSAEYVASCSF